MRFDFHTHSSVERRRIWWIKHREGEEDLGGAVDPGRERRQLPVDMRPREVTTSIGQRSESATGSHGSQGGH